MLRIWLLEVPSPVLGGSVSAGLAVFDGFLLLFISAGRVGQLSPEYPVVAVLPFKDRNLNYKCNNGCLNFEMPI